MNCSAVFFDLDGTLLDTLEDLADAANEVLQRQGYQPHAVEEYNSFVGDGLQTLIDRILPEGASEHEREESAVLFKSIYGHNWHHKTTPYDGIPALLDQLQDARIRLAILSNKPHEYTQMYVQHYFPNVPFEIILGQRSGIPKKPDPAGAVELAEKMNLEPEHCIFVGDTGGDMQTGKRAGMQTIGVLWGFRSADELRMHGADLLVATPAELARILCARDS
ncbi:MAG: HAD family hydrolase [Desulfopila sp.]